MRIERDSLGKAELEDNIYYGIHTKRALENFKNSQRRVNWNLIKSIVKIKLAAVRANFEVKKINKEKKEVIEKACIEILEGGYKNQFPISSMQGGAGTSTNMNVNEVIANIAIEKLGGKKGDYDMINPIEDVNLSQSTNDVYPTAVKISIIGLLNNLVDQVMKLQSELQKKEDEFSNVFKMGRTQLKDAVPITLGQEFSAYADAISRDRWRLYKIEERIRQVNIGGTAIGTGVGAPLKYRYLILQELQRLTGFGLARAENLIDNTQNLDLYVEVSGLLKSLAVNLKKISNDLRLMDSGPNTGLGEINLPKIQMGSSIMPGKVNPVGPEYMIQICYKIFGNDSTITIASASGEFELNPMHPLIAELMLENLEILTDGIEMFSKKVIKGITVNEKRCREYLQKSWSVSSFLLEKVGYETLTEVLKESQKTGKSYKDILVSRGLLDKEDLKKGE
ncbi:MAG: aspartate ammonia-lyase [Fusobacteriota bacterium]